MEIDDVLDLGDRILVQAQTADLPARCPDCGAVAERIHAFCERTVADVPVDARQVSAVVRVRRLRCDNIECPRLTFREQVPGLLDPYQRRTRRLASWLGAVVHELAGRASQRLTEALSMEVSRRTAIRMLLRLPLPPRRTPTVLGVDDFALWRRKRYATVLIDAVTGERIDVLPDRYGGELLPVPRLRGRSHRAPSGRAWTARPRPSRPPPPG